MLKKLYHILAAVSAILNFCLIPYTGLRVHMFLPGFEHGLQPVLAGAVVTVLLVMPWCYDRGMTYSRLLNGCLAAQISGALIIALQQFQFEPDYLWPLTISALILGLDYPQLHKMLTFVNFNLFRCSLSAGTALIGVYAQTLLALTIVNDYPHLLLLASINTIIVGLNLKPFLNQNLLNGPTIIDHYLTFWEKIRSGPLNRRSLLIRVLLIVLSLIMFNPLLAYAA